MATIRILLGIICLAAFGRGRLFGSDLLVESGRGTSSITQQYANRLKSAVKCPFWAVNGPKVSVNCPKLTITSLGSLMTKSGKQSLKKRFTRMRHIKIAAPDRLSVTQMMKQELVLNIARNQLGVVEKTGKNDGVRIERYLHYVGLPKGAPWCAAFVSWVFGEAGYSQPRTGWSPALFPKNRTKLLVKPATVFGIYFPQLKRVAHCGLVEHSKGNWMYTIEGNTNIAGNRDGDGVYRKIRHRRTIAIYADWMKKIDRGGER